MKKTLLILAAALAIGSGATLALTQGAAKQATKAESTAQTAPKKAQDVKTAVMPGSGYWSKDYPYNIGGYDLQNSSAIYPASALDALVGLDKYTITEIVYPVKNCPTSGTLTVSLMGATSSATSLTEPYKGEMQALATNYIIDFENVSSDEIRIPLTTPMVMEKGQSLILNLYVTKSWVYGTPTVQNTDFGDGTVNHVYYTMWGDADWYSGSAFAPCFNFDYVEGEVAGGGDTPDFKDAVMSGSGYWSKDYPYNIGGYDLQNSSAIYPASALDALVGLDKYTITEIVYPVKNCPTSGTLTVSLMGATSSATSLTEPYKGEMQALATNYIIDFENVSSDEIRIPLTTPMVMDKGQSLILNLYVTKSWVYGTPTVQNTDFGDGTVNHVYYTMWGDADWYSSSAFAPCFNFTYVEGEYAGGEKPKATDLSASKLNAPYGQLYTGVGYDFEVTVRNSGDLDVSHYTVELYNTENNQVLASEEIWSTLSAGLSKTVTLTYSFETAGTFSLAGRVVCDEDTNDDNNVTEAVTVDVEALAYRACNVLGNATPELNTNEVYQVVVLNEGDTDLIDFQVSLYLVREGMADQLIKTIYVDAPLAPQQPVLYSFDYSFALAGNYGLKGVVVKGDGQPSETAVFNVTIDLDKLAPVITNQFPKWDGATYDWYSRAVNRSSWHSGSLLLYPSSYFGEHENAYQIQSLGFTVPYEEYPVQPFKIKVYLAQTELEALDAEALIPEEDFTLVYDGIFSTERAGAQLSFDPQVVTLELQKLFTLESGKGLAVNLEIDAMEKGVYYLAMATVKTEETSVLYTVTDADIPGFSIYNRGGGRITTYTQLPCLTLGYALEPLAEKLDLAVTGFELRTAVDEIKADETELSFRVNFTNAGTVAVESGEYTIELIDVNTTARSGEPRVLASFEGSRDLGPGASSFQTVKYVFNQGGSFNVAARIVIDDDVNTANDISTEVIPLEVIGEQSGVDSLIAEGTLSYDPATSTLFVNLGKCKLTVTDLAGRVIASQNLDGAAEVSLELNEGVYVISANGKFIKIRK